MHCTPRQLTGSSMFADDLWVFREAVRVPASGRTFGVLVQNAITG